MHTQTMKHYIMKQGCHDRESKKQKPTKRKIVQFNSCHRSENSRSVTVIMAVAIASRTQKQGRDTQTRQHDRSFHCTFIRSTVFEKNNLEYIEPVFLEIED